MTRQKKCSINVHIDTYERLLRRKIVPDETMNTVINRILNGDTHEQPR